mgnify:CR=1 FL=1|tara:strand:- start:1278 stop:2621 length:1344 start_codon:yes stop_codon:yes gene_type:complete
MSTHDYNIANASGASVRSDLNSALAAILSNNSNASSPSTTVSYSTWVDTSTNKLKIRNTANDDWVDLINLDGTIARDLQLTGASANIIFDQSDNALEFNDNAKAVFGTGGDLEISHNGSNSIINDAGTGELQLQRGGNTILALTSSGVDLTDPDGTANFRIKAGEGGNASVILEADEADDHGDKWQLSSRASGNSFKIYNDTSGSLVEKFSISTAGNVEFQGDLTIPDKIIHSGDSDTAIRFGTDNQVTIETAGTERARFQSNVLFHSTVEPDSSNAGVRFTSSSYHSIARDTSASSVLRVFGTNGEFRTMGDGDAENTNNRYGQISDITLKENIVDANSQWNDIKAIKVRNWNFKESTGYSTHRQIGVVAQELESLGMNGLVKNNSDELYIEGDELPEGKNIGDVKQKGYKTVAYSVLYMKAIKALQEAMVKIETLETKVAALEAA